MFKKTKLKLTVKKTAKPSKSALNAASISLAAKIKTDSKKPSFACRVLKYIASVPAKIWNWIKNIDIIGLANVTLLVIIIVMFAMLLMNVLKYHYDDDNVPAITAQDESKALPQLVDIERKPLRAKTIKVQASISVDPNTLEATIKLPLKQALPQPEADSEKSDMDLRRSGDVIIDGKYISDTLPANAVIDGNLILQNMRVFKLPCGVHIDGHIILRNVGQLRFCRDFAVAGNIYVNRDSSFGPIPKTAHVGGNIIF